MTVVARGTFDVKVLPQPSGDAAGGAFARFFLDKKFHGDLDAVSQGEMLAAGGPDKGEGGYVALERVTGTLHGKRGSFVLQHRGTMSGGDYHMDITVVPGSGTEELTGLAGTLTITIDGKLHRYELATTLATP